MGVDRQRFGLRKAELRDVRSIQAIDQQVYPTPWSEKLLIREISSSGRVHLVAEDRSTAAHRVVAHGAILILLDEAHVSTIAVDPKLQGNGLGSVLLHALIDGAIDNGCEALTLEVRAGNEAALSMYRTFGLAPVGVRRGYYGDNGEDAIVLWSPKFDDEYRSRLADLDSLEVG